MSRPVRTTLRQVAECSGVSVVSASHILGGQGERYREATRRRVWEAARELNYQPNLVGRALVRGKTMSVGVIVQGLRGRVETARLWTMLETAREHGYQPYLATSGRHDQKHQRLVEIARDLTGRRVDGLIVVRSMPLSDEARQYLQSLSVPVVFVNWGPPRHKARIIFDVEAGVDQLAEHLAGLGHRRAVLFVARESADFREHKIHPYRRAFARHGMELTIDYEQESSEDPGLQVHRDIDPEHRGYRAVRRHLTSGDPATVLCMNNDETALGALAALREAGLSVPGDISLVGFNDIAMAQYCDPPMTTVRIPGQEVGQAAFEMLYHLMTAPQTPVAPKRFPFELVVRASTGPVPRSARSS